jgi:peptidoglycan/xylan/chitin deacetylase (PgdA/CDA1 family)
MYHSLSDGRWPDRKFPKFAATLAGFGEQIARLADRGFRLESVASVVARLEAGAPLPEKLCALTVDDGHRSALDMAPVLEAHGAGATFFLTAGYCRDREDFLKPGEIRELAGRGFDFGAHGWTHRALSELPREEMVRELRESKGWLEEVLGREVISMSLPGGNGGAAVHRAAFGLGYRAVGNSVEWPNRPGPLPLRLNRYVVEASYGADLVGRIAGGDLAHAARRRARAALLWLPKRILKPHRKLRG